MISLGCDADFWFSSPTSSRKVIRVKSGDVILFDSSSNKNIQHGIDRIYSNSCPPHLSPFCNESRISVQFRQKAPFHIDIQSEVLKDHSVDNIKWLRYYSPLDLIRNHKQKTLVSPHTKDIYYQIFSYLSLNELRACESVCWFWNCVLSLDEFWRFYFEDLKQRHPHKLPTVNKYRSPVPVQNLKEPGVDSLSYNDLPQYENLELASRSKCFAWKTVFPEEYSLCFDIGDHQISVGFNGEDLPRVVLRNQIYCATPEGKIEAKKAIQSNGDVDFQILQKVMELGLERMGIISQPVGFSVLVGASRFSKKARYHTLI